MIYAKEKKKLHCSVYGACRAFAALAVALAFSGSVAAGDASGPAEKNVLRIGGGAAPLENVFRRVKGPFEAETGIKLDLVECGPVAAWSGLVTGEFDVAVTDSDSIYKIKWRDLLARENSEIKHAELPDFKLSTHFLGVDLTCVYTHPDVKVRAFEPAELKAVFTGLYTNWNMFGGPSMPITIILPEKDDGMLDEFRKSNLDGAAFTERVIRVDAASDAKAKVLETPGAISLGPLGLIDEQEVNVISYPASRRKMFMIWKWDAWKRDAIKALHYYIISEEGKKYMLKGVKKKENQK